VKQILCVFEVMCFYPQ